jgi:putative flippase GtrA
VPTSLTNDSLQQLVRLLRFAVVSGTGLALDIAIFLSLYAAGIVPFAANAVGSAVGLTFVYFASVRRVFRYEGRFLPAMFAIYAAYQFCGTILVSWLVAALITNGVSPPLAKVGILPATFSANYLFMQWLTSNTKRWANLL